MLLFKLKPFLYVHLYMTVLVQLLQILSNTVYRWHMVKVLLDSFDSFKFYVGIKYK